jgi:hypothetical protein
MANKEEIQIKIDAAVESAEAAKSLGQLKKSLIEIQTLQAELGDTSGAQFDKLSAASANASSKLAETRDRIGDIVDKNKTLEGTPVERLTGSFNLLKESVMNLDFDKAKIGAEGLINTFTPVVDGKMVTGLAGVKGAFANLAEGVKSLGSTFMSVGKALLTNPIFLLAAAIIAIVAVVVLIMDKLGILKKVIDALMIPINAVIKGFEMLTDWLGLTTNALEDQAEAAKKNGETQRAEIDATATAQKNLLKLTEGMTDEEVALFKKKAGIKDNLNKNSFDIEKTRLTQTQATLKNEINALEELKAAGGELTEDQQKDLEQRKKDYAANAASIKQIEFEKVKYLIDLQSKIAKSADEWRLKAMKDDNERSKAQLELSKIEDLRKVDVLLRDAKLNKASAADIAKLNQEKKDIETYYADQTQKINEAVQKKAVDASKTASDKQSQLLQKQLKEKEDYWKVEVEKTEKGTQARIDKEVQAENAIFKFKEDNAKKLGLSKKQIELLDIQLQQSQLERQEAFNKKEEELDDKARIAKDNIAIIKAESDDELYIAKRKLIQDQAAIDIKAAKDSADEQERIAAEAYVAIEALDNEYNTKKAEDDAIYTELLVSKTQFEIDQYNKKVQGVLLLDSKQRDQLIKLDMEEQIALEAAMTLELSNTELTEAQKAEIKERYRQLNIQQQEAADQRLKDAKIKAAQDDLEIAQKGFTAIQGLTDAFFAFKKRNLAKGSAEELKAAKQQFNTNKALQLGIATVTGIQSVLSAFSNGMKNPVPLLGPATAAVYAAIAGVTAAANIAKIAASKFDGGSPSPDTGSSPSPSAGLSGGADTTPAPTNFMPNQFFGLGQETATGMPGGQKPIKVYVTEHDITHTQEQVAVIEQRAKLGP